MDDRHQLWAVITQIAYDRSERKVMASLGVYPSYDEAIEAWQLADGRMRSGRREISLIRPKTQKELAYGLGKDRMSSDGRTERLDYLAVRSVEDEAWRARYPHLGDSRRWATLLAGKGSRVFIRIFGNVYPGIVTESRRLTAEVSFRTVGDPTIRTGSFPILPRSYFDRGIHGLG